MNYWDQQRERISFPQTDEYKLYQIKKLLGLAQHKLLAITEAKETLAAALETKQRLLIALEEKGLTGTRIAHKRTKAIDSTIKSATKQLDAGTSINAYANDASDQNYTGTRNKTAKIILEEHLATPAALIRLYESLPTSIYYGQNFGSTLKQLINFLEDQETIFLENKQLRSTASKAKRTIKSLTNKKTKLEQRLTTTNKLATLLEQIDEIDANILAAKQELEDSIKAYRPQTIIRWEGLRPELEIAKSHTRIAEIYGNAAADALATAHGIPNSALSKARKLLTEYSLNKSGQFADHLAASFPGFPEATDLMQESLLSLHQKQQRREGSNACLRAGLMNQETAERWSKLKRAASTQKRDLAAAMTGPMALHIAQPEAEAWDLYDHIQLNQIPILMEKCLTDKQRKAFTLCEIEGYSQRDAANTLGIDRKSLGDLLRASRKKLQAALTA